MFMSGITCGTQQSNFCFLESRVHVEHEINVLPSVKFTGTYCTHRHRVLIVLSVCLGGS